MIDDYIILSILSDYLDTFLVGHQAVVGLLWGFAADKCPHKIAVVGSRYMSI
jgi:hypothetical protein